MKNLNALRLYLGEFDGLKQEKAKVNYRIGSWSFVIFGVLFTLLVYKITALMLENDVTELSCSRKPSWFTENLKGVPQIGFVR